MSVLRMPAMKALTGFEHLAMEPRDAHLQAARDISRMRFEMSSRRRSANFLRRFTE